MWGRTRLFYVEVEPFMKKLRREPWEWCKVLLAIILCFCGCAQKEELKDPVFSLEDVTVQLTEAGMTSVERLDTHRWEDRIKDSVPDLDLSEFGVYRFYYECDGLQIEGYMSIPLHLLEETGPKPCLIYNHGGNRDFGALNGSETLGWAYNLDMICIASNYRGCGGSEGEDGFGGEDVNDILRLIDLCVKADFLDPGQINMLGASRGGMMTYEVLRRDDRIHRAAVTGGMADAFAMYEARDDMKKVFLDLVGGTPENMPEEYERRSAVCWADEIHTPLLMIHSRGDARVEYSQAEELAAELEKYNKEYLFFTYDDSLHAGIHQEDMETVRSWFLDY